MSRPTRSLLASLLVPLVVSSTGCCPLGGGGSTSTTSTTSTTPTAPPAAPPRFTPQMSTTANLPGPAQFLRFGDSTVAHVKGHFTLPTHYVTESRDTSFGGTRDVMGMVGLNKGVKMVRVGVRRTQMNGVYQGP
ncbi:MAG: hypothetical protein IT379_38900, partial [Deltaproteobacteria bacterium]|nr:hypothetical protein [Deltaproteobacteria bacterium]